MKNSNSKTENSSGNTLKSRTDMKTPRLIVKDLPPFAVVPENDLEKITGGLVSGRIERIITRRPGDVAWNDGGCCGCTGIRG